MRRTFPSVDLSDVTNETHTRTRRSEVPSDQIDRARSRALLRLVPRRRMTRYQLLSSHDQLHDLVATHVTLTGELRMNTPVPVCAVRLLKHRSNLDRKLRTYKAIKVGVAHVPMRKAPRTLRVA